MAGLKRLSLLVVLVLMAAVGAPLEAGLEDNVREVIRAGGLGNASVSVLAVDLDTGELLVAIDPDRPIIPASNMKLVTSAAALHVLGPQFVFETRLLLARGSSEQAATLVVLGDGDPGFGDPELIRQHDKLEDVEDMLKLWVKAVQDAGITRVERLIVDDRVFDRVRPAEQLRFRHGQDRRRPACRSTGAAHARPCASRV